MTKLINCAAGDELGYPAYYRAVYTLGHGEPDFQFAAVVDGVYDTMSGGAFGSSRGSGLAQPLNNPAPAAGDVSAVMDLKTIDATAGRHTVAELTRELDVAPLWGIIPDIFAAVVFTSLERIPSSAAYSDQNRDAARQKAAAEKDNDAWANIAKALMWLVILVVVLSALWGAAKVYRAAT
jgi:hypothetical protein